MAALAGPRVPCEWLVVASAQLGLCFPAAAAVPGPARDGAICQTRVDYIFEHKISESMEFCRLSHKHKHCQTKYFMQWVEKWRVKIVEKSATLGESADIDSLATKVALRRIMSTFPPIVNFGHKMLLKQQSYDYPMNRKFCLQTKLLTFLCSQELRNRKRKAGGSAQAHCAVGRIHVI